MRDDLCLSAGADRLAPDRRPGHVLTIGIGGASGSGKTTLARAAAACFARACAIMPLDAYYRDLSGLPLEERARTNFDTPEALDWELLLKHVSRLRRGRPVSRPVYSFATHTRSTETVGVPVADLLIVEGLFALYWPELVAAYDLPVFLDAPDDLCLQRRLARDASERGRTPESVRRQYTDVTRPMYLLHVLPTRSAARLVLDGSVSSEANVARVLAELRAVHPDANDSRPLA